MESQRMTGQISYTKNKKTMKMSWNGSVLPVKKNTVRANVKARVNKMPLQMDVDILFHNPTLVDVDGKILMGKNRKDVHVTKLNIKDKKAIQAAMLSLK
jgi:hypothetical protein